jgi:hypothetical protein
MTSSATGSSRLINPYLVLVKGLILFIIINLICASIYIPYGKLSLYNILLPGRERFPFAEEVPEKICNLTITNLDAMFSSHIIASPKSKDEYRVVLLGDSSVWGASLRPEDTLAGQLDAANLITCDGRKVHVYNLGYPRNSITKDVLILSEAMRYEPDLIAWITTLGSLTLDRRLDHPIVLSNHSRVIELSRKYNLQFDFNTISFQNSSFVDRTLIGSRRDLFDWARLQLYGVLWAATGVDQIYRNSYKVYPIPELTDNISFFDWQPPAFDLHLLSLDVLEAGMEIAGRTPVILVNEPILIISGQKNSDLRYDPSYPRWVYDQYRQIMNAESKENDWHYIDLWDLVPSNEFWGDTDMHLMPAGEARFAERLIPYIQSTSCP